MVQFLNCYAYDAFPVTSKEISKDAIAIVTKSDVCSEIVGDVHLLVAFLSTITAQDILLFFLSYSLTSLPMYLSALVSINLLVPHVGDRPFSRHSTTQRTSVVITSYIHTSSFYLIGTTLALFIFDRGLLAGFVSIKLFHWWKHSMRAAAVLSIVALLGILPCWIHASRRISVDEGPFCDPRLPNSFVSPHTFIDGGLFKRSSLPKQPVFVSGRAFVDGGLFFG